MALTVAERLLQELGVTSPNEIDLEAIAFHLNATVKYRQLDGCEARIVGAGNRAVITVNNSSGWRRKALFDRARTRALAPPQRQAPSVPCRRLPTAR